VVEGRATNLQYFQELRSVIPLEDYMTKKPLIPIMRSLALAISALLLVLLPNKWRHELLRARDLVSRDAVKVFFCSHGSM
jgi:hypothetical protein